MKHLYLIVFLLGVCTSLNGQLKLFPTKDFKKQKMKQYLYQGCLMLVGGAADGTREIIQFKYQNFKDVHPTANDDYWNPKESWKNKWKNGDNTQGEKFFGSSTFLVSTTDAYHMLRTVDRSTMFGAAILGVTSINLGEKQKWYWYIIDFAYMTLVRSVGFNITYRFVYDGI